MVRGAHVPRMTSEHGERLRDDSSYAPARVVAEWDSIGMVAEQSQRLLEDGSGGDDKNSSDMEGVAIPRRRSARWPTCLYFLAVLASFLSLLLLVKIAFLDTAVRVDPGASVPPTTAIEQPAVTASVPAAQVPTSITEPDDQVATFRRPDSDYILDPSWDFDAPPTVREYHWVVRNIEANPDGVFRLMTVINGKFPGELIRCNEGDTIVVNVQNRGVNSTSIHWHGLFQNGTNHMDGTPGATQCPIAPGRSFRYEFTVKGQSGTYFYHGHQGAEALDGMIGPIVVHSRDEAKNQLLPYQSDRVVMVQDWYHDLSNGLLKEALAPGSESSPMPNGGLINGANIVDCTLYPDRRCDNSTARLPTLDLAANANHRLRFINIGGFAWFEITLDRHHNLPITEIDGVDIEPSSEKSILIAPGQRYSVVLTANETNTSDRAYWLRARIATHCFAEYALADKDKAVALAIVRYTDSARIPSPEGSTGKDPLDPSRLPTTDSDSGAYIVVCRDMHTQSYKPVPVQAAPASADYSYFFRLNLEIHGYQLQRGYFNESSYRPNLPSPALHRAVDGLRADNESFHVTGVNDAAFDRVSELVIAQSGIKIIDLIFQNFDEGTHPLHLHGHQMYVLGSGHGYFPGYEAFGLKPEGKGLLDPKNASTIANPVRRDVATVEGFGWTMLRVVLDNPGVWKFHCHMVWHGDGGMALLLLSRTDLLRDWTIPEANRALCEASSKELEKGAAPKDSIWYDDKK